jgi:ribokinase
MKIPRIVVVGSSNYDMIAYTDRLPVIGETIHGYKFEMGFGGKGANQAAAAAKLGAEVTMVTKLGKDIFGEQTFENYVNLGIKTDHVTFTDKALSGVAPIAVDKEGNNSIIVVAGANDYLTAEDVENARNDIKNADILICQIEIPNDINKKAMTIAKEEGTKVIFNPAPAPEGGISEDLLKLCNIFCPNETEAEIITGIEINTVKDAEKAIVKLLSLGITEVIITMGSNGCLYGNGTELKHIKTEKVNAKDTSGAGDCFIGSYAYFSCMNIEYSEAVRRANYVAAESVKGNGTQKSYLFKKDLPDFLFNL